MRVLLVQAPPTTGPTHPSPLLFKPRPPHAQAPPTPRPCLRPAVAEGLRGVLGSRAVLETERTLVRLRGVVGRVPLQLGLGTAERLVQSAAAAPGRAFQIVADVRRNGGAATEGPRRAAGERGGGLRVAVWTEIRSRASSVALHACRLHPRRRARTGAGRGRRGPSHLRVPLRRR